MGQVSSIKAQLYLDGAVGFNQYRNGEHIVYALNLNPRLIIVDIDDFHSISLNQRFGIGGKGSDATITKLRKSNFQLLLDQSFTVEYNWGFGASQYAPPGRDRQLGYFVGIGYATNLLIRIDELAFKYSEGPVITSGLRFKMLGKPMGVFGRFLYKSSKASLKLAGDNLGPLEGSNVVSIGLFIGH